MLSKSVVTKLFSFPMRLDCLGASALGSSLDSPFVDSAVRVSVVTADALESCVPDVSSSFKASAGLIVGGSGVVTLLLRAWSLLPSCPVSAIKRIRRLCSNTSWVIIASVRASERVAKKIYPWNAIEFKVGPTNIQRIQNQGRIVAPIPPDSRYLKW